MQNILKPGRRIKTKTSELYSIAENSGTEIICCDLPKTFSVSVRTAPGRCYIGMDPFGIETTAQERVHLAHEIGHCETHSFYNPYSPLEIRERQERRADRWAISKLIPFSELAQALTKGINELWELADYFDVTEDFISKAVEFYKLRGELARFPLTP